MKNLPEIHLTNRHGSDVHDDALDAVIRANDPPFIFVRRGRLVRVNTDGQVDPLSHSTCRWLLSNAAVWTQTERGERVIVRVPPGSVVSHFLNVSSWPGIPAFKEDQDP